MIFGTRDTSLESSHKTLYFGSWENFSMLFVWKLRGFKVFQNLPISVALYSDAPISDAPIFAHLVEHLEEHLNK